MANVLFIGGTGEISAACAQQAVNAGHSVTAFNRGRTPCPDGVKQITGHVGNPSELEQAGKQNFDVVCQFLAFNPEDIQRDIKAFAGRCSQYIFVSSASAYRKPWRTGLITEETPLKNPFMAYSRNKAACETVVRDSVLPYTIVRPSHTYRERLPSPVLHGDHMLWRMLRGQPILIHDQGESLWTVTHADDFARAFTALYLNEAARGEAFHITDSKAHAWNHIVRTVADLCQVEAVFCHVASHVLADLNEDWRGPLLGDKANSLVFDNRKISAVADGWACDISLANGLRTTLASAMQRQALGYAPPEALDHLVSRIVADHG